MDVELRGKLEGCNQQVEEYKVRGYSFTSCIIFVQTHTHTHLLDKLKKILNNPARIVFKSPKHC